LMRRLATASTRVTASFLLLVSNGTVEKVDGTCACFCTFRHARIWVLCRTEPPHKSTGECRLASILNLCLLCALLAFPCRQALPRILSRRGWQPATSCHHARDPQPPPAAAGLHSHPLPAVEEGVRGPVCHPAPNIHSINQHHDPGQLPHRGDKGRQDAHKAGAVD
jgi:hypothetical protein